MATLAPFLAKLMAVPAPIPELAPVIKLNENNAIEVFLLHQKL